MSTCGCWWTKASSTKLGAWRRAGVRVIRTGRRTHRQEPAEVRTLSRCRAARAGRSIGSRENLRDTAQRALSREERMLSIAGRGRRQKAPSISPSSNPPLPAALPAHLAALRRAHHRRCATGAAVWPRQGPPPPHRSQRAPDIAPAAAAPDRPPPYLPTSPHSRPAGPTNTAVRQAGRRVTATIPAPTRAGCRSAIIATLPTRSASAAAVRKHFMSPKSRNS